jgi:hypothetical protein
MEPGPIPTFTASAPAKTSSEAASAEHTLGVAVCRIYHDGIYIGLYQFVDPVHGVGSDSDCSRDSQPAFVVLAGIGLVFDLCNILVGNQSHQFIVFVNDRKLLDFIVLQNFRGFFQIR